MMKRFVACLMMVVLCLSFVTCAMADEKLQWPDYNRHDLGYTEGTVISHNASVRVEPNESAKKICSVYNGQYLKINAIVGNWYLVDLENLGNPDGHTQGYILSYYVMNDYNCLYLRKGSAIYPYAGAEKRIGYLSAGQFYTILGETQNYWIINARTCAAYLPKSAAVFLSSEMQYYYSNNTYAAIVSAKNAKIYSGPGTSWNQVGKLEQNTSISILWSDGNWYSFMYDDDGAKVLAYIKISDVQLK
ncbi:MAG: SH3 domain-containing protein [Clostridia bacterium]|nr:SH3 domain-containing protein [Clostridia bacterium]